MPDEIKWPVGLLVLVIVTAAAVNRFAPHHRPRLRRVAVLYLLYVAVLGIDVALHASGSTAWAGRFDFATDLLASFNVVNILATLAISVLLPASGMAVPMIATDLAVGLGYIIATLGVASQRGMNPTGALASAAVVSAVLAISLQSTLGNILGGVALQLDGSVHEGDWIQLENGRQGKVRAIRWRHTVVETRDWSTIIVPNSQLLANNITILGKRDGQYVPQRLWVYFNVDFRHPPARVIEVVTDALRASPIEGVAGDPPANCVCMDFGRDNRVSMATYAVRFWLTDLAADDPAASRVRTRIFAALRRAGIPLAMPGEMQFVQYENDQRLQRKQQQRAAERVEALRSVALFRSLTEAEIQTLAEGLTHVVYSAGETITRQGNVAHYLYLLTSGTAQVRAWVDPDGDGPRPSEQMMVATLQSPDVFGEMGLMTGEPRSADVVAITDVDCFRLGKETFEHVLLARPEIATELSNKLANRRVELIAAREGLDARQRKEREDTERDRILGGIKSFFAL